MSSKILVSGSYNNSDLAKSEMNWKIYNLG